jgi:hypothetical protein
MKFGWVACEPNCRGWVSAVGIITADTPKDFDDFARGRQLGGATVVLDSSGGSVNDAITLGRRFRNLGLLTTVGITQQSGGGQGARPAVASEAYCESMCAFLLLAGKKRYVPEAAHVRVHQIWMGDRADDAKAASYSAQDLMIVERDIGRLAKYTFDMGGAGDLLSLALNVPPWEDLHELDAAELKRGSARSRRSLPSRPRRRRLWCRPGARQHRPQHHRSKRFSFSPARWPAASPWPRSGRLRPPRHRRSAASRRGAPCSRGPARGI